MKASVIVPTCNRALYLRDALHSVIRQDIDPETFEIIVVDNNSTDNTHEVTLQVEKSSSNHIRYVHEPVQGLHRARHRGADEARGDILVYAEDDIIASPGWLKSHLRHYADEHVVCVGGRVAPRWEGIPPSWVPFLHPGWLSLLDMGDKRIRLKMPRNVCGGNMSIRAEILELIGGFNPDGFVEVAKMLYRGDGETGMQHKLYDRGYTILYDPDALLYHRIPENRLTAEYYDRRLWNEGFSQNFTWFRDTRKKPPALFAYSVLFSCTSILTGLLARKVKGWKGILLNGYHFKYKARAKHSFELACNSTFREYVKQHSFWKPNQQI